MSMVRPRVFLFAALALVWLAPARADDALRTDVFAYDTGDGTWVSRTGLTWLYRYAGLDDYRGVELEHWRGNVTSDGVADGPGTVERQRAYFRFAHPDGDWRWTGRLGTDSHTALGSLSAVHEVRRRAEFFAERDMVETPQGLDGLYHTYAGAAVDLPYGKDDRQVLTLLGGAQVFSNDNIRAHLRLRWSGVLNPGWGLSAQLSFRAFHDSNPGDADYYSPRWFVEALPTLQLRRFRSGWMWLARAAVGRQRDAASDWHTARRVELSVTSPATRKGWHLSAGLLATDTPIGSAKSDYRQFSFEAVKQF
jgi:hypothetical protein